MASNQPTSGSNLNGTPNPPGFATHVLAFFLPAALREPVLGDLEEEFAYRLFCNDSAVKANRWYWRQVIGSSCLYFWQQRGTVMAYLISVVFFGLIFALGVATGGFGLWYIMPPPLIATIPASLLLGIGATSAQAAKTAFKLSFHDAGDHSPQSVNLARRFLKVTGNQFLLVAGVVFFMSAIQWLFSLSRNPDLLRDASHYATLGFALLPLFYGMAFKCLFYSAEQKLLWKYAEEQ